LKVEHKMENIRGRGQHLREDTLPWGDEPLGEKTTRASKGLKRPEMQSEYCR